MTTASAGLGPALFALERHNGHSSGISGASARGRSNSLRCVELAVRRHPSYLRMAFLVNTIALTRLNRVFTVVRVDRIPLIPTGVREFRARECSKGRLFARPQLISDSSEIPMILSTKSLKKRASVDGARLQKLVDRIERYHLFCHRAYRRYIRRRPETTTSKRAHSAWAANEAKFLAECNELRALLKRTRILTAVREAQTFTINSPMSQGRRSRVRSRHRMAV